MKLCMFDLDGTLGYLTGGDGPHFAETIRSHFGEIPVDTTWESYPFVTDLGIVETLYERHVGEPPSSGVHDALCADFIRRMAASVDAGEAEFVLVDGARDIVESLSRDHGWHIALATGGWRASAQWKMRRAGLDLSAHARAYSEDGPAREGVMRAALERATAAAGREIERVVYVGDGVWDARACTALDWPFVGIAPEPEHADRLRALGASHVLPDLADIEAVLTALADATPPTLPT